MGFTADMDLAADGTSSKELPAGLFEVTGKIFIRVCINKREITEDISVLKVMFSLCSALIN
jgi:hypothetical protein